MSASRKFTGEVQQIILDALRENPSIYSAAAAANITYPTLMRWLQKGQEGAEGYAEFLQAVEEARSHMKNEIVQSLYEISCDRLHPQAVRAARELLTALYPKEFSSVSVKHIVSHQAKNEDMDLSKLPAEELRVFRKTLLKLQSGGEDPPKPATPVIEVLEASAGKSRTAN